MATTPCTPRLISPVTRTKIPIFQLLLTYFALGISPVSPTKHLEMAVFTLKIAENDLLLDSVRALSTPGTPPKIARSAQDYVEKCYDSALILFSQSGKYPFHDHDTDRNDP